VMRRWCASGIGFGLWLTLCLSRVAAQGPPNDLTLSSAAFSPGAEIPKQHTCDGADLSPPLGWRGTPQGTKSIALIVDDPDAPAGTWVHWVLYDLPGDSVVLAGGVPKKDTLVSAAKQGVNDFRTVGYAGPCPPPGKLHHYFFKLYALDAPLGLSPHATKADVLQAIEGHILAHAELVGTYKR